MIAPRLAVAVLAIAAAALAGGCGQRVSVEQRLQAAMVAIDNYEYDVASLELDNALHEDPNNARVRLLHARVSLAAGRADVAERQIRAARRLDAPTDESEPLLARALLAQGKFQDIIVEQEPSNASASVLAYRGLAHLHLGMHDRAVENFRQALAKSPGMTLARVGVARAAQAEGDGRLAEGLLREVIDSDPFDVAAHQALGALYHAQDRLVEAERAFREALALPVNLDNIDAWLLASIGLIETQWRVGKRARALIETRQLLEQFPSHPLPKYARALLAYHDRDYELASQYLRQVLRALPDHRPSQQLSAAAHFAQGRLGSAQIQLGEATNDPDMAKLLADVYLQMGNGRDAQATLDPVMATAQDPLSFELYATAAIHAGDQATSHHYMGRALLEGVPSLSRQIRYAAILLNAGRIEQADRLMAGWPANAQTENARAMLRLLRFLRDHDLDRASEYAKRRRRENPSDLLALLTLAEAAEKKGHREQAEGWLDVARERNPEAVEPRFLLANYAARRGDTEEMIALAEEVLAVQPYNADALSLLGNAYLATGNSASAIGTLREALRVAPNSARAAIDLARAQLATGDFWEARKMLRATLLRDDVSPQQLTGLIVEEYQRGNEEQARALAADLQDFDRNDPAGYSVEGDLHMLHGEFGKALDAYQVAQRMGAGRAAAVKAFAAAVAADTDDPSEPLDTWLRNAPQDRQIRRIVDTL